MGGVDLYVGGVEHAVLHLLYSRFWHKVLFDLGSVTTPEPFQRLYNQGYILAPAYVDERGFYVEATEVVPDALGGFTFEGRPVTQEMGKMGKSLKNSVPPETVYEEYGADTLRLYEMYMGPLDADRPWNARDIIGVHRFLARLWRALIDEESGEPRVVAEPADPDLRRLLHRAIAAVREDMAGLRFNTAVAELIKLTNALPGVVEARGRRPTRRCWSTTRSSSRCRWPARCGAASGSRPAPTRRRCGRRPWPTRRSRRPWRGATYAGWWSCRTASSTSWCDGTAGHAG
jgi:leucyl-tRNA synthetase